jgi:hypothetical protein
MAEDEKSRPNEGLPLTENRIPEEGLQFYYSREHRLSKAPDTVRSLYAEKGPSKFNLLRPLISSKSNAILFGTMVSLALITVVMSFSGIMNRGGDYQGNRITASAIRYDGAAVILLKKNARNVETAYTGPLYISVSPTTTPTTATAVATYPYRVVLSSRKTEEFRFSVPFEENELQIEISGEGEDGAVVEGSLAFKIKTK